MTSVIVPDDFSPIYVGDVGASFAPVFAYKDGTAFPLTGASITARMTNGSIIKTWDPTKWTIDDAAGGKAHYAYQAADVDTAGEWAIYITITIGGKPVHGAMKYLDILPGI